MPDFWTTMTDGFMPHGYCLRWNGPLVLVFIVGNLGIALAYFLIPAALRYFIGKRKDVPYAHIFKLFAAFILSCGLTHIAKVWTLYQPVYWIEAGLDLWTAAVSLVTAAALFPLIPKALMLRSPKALEEANRLLETQIVEREKAEQSAETARLEAESARDEAIRADALKSQFMANVSHEIRTPMSGIIGMAELMTRSPDSEDSQELAARIFNSSKQLLNVLNALLDFSKLDAGKVEILKVPFSPDQLVDDVISLVKPNADSKGLSLEKEVELPAKILGDDNRIRQVLLNFVHNAVKFTDQGTVKISATVHETQNDKLIIKFSVSDTGIGINESGQSSLFQPFVQADGSTTRRFGGTGLGLAIAKQLAELMGGETGYTSQENHGSTFWFTVCTDAIPDDHAHNPSSVSDR